jgi:hypothetical protein
VLRHDVLGFHASMLVILLQVAVNDFSCIQLSFVLLSVMILGVYCVFRFFFSLRHEVLPALPPNG